ncbi:hypothetical protein [Nitrospirillum viridazoti]|uniref:Uncharacterized protein n=2 Tax=Nitrospirillum TaxID=1543705 RepID=A0A248JQ54_9PROT|nr:hypothetical protein [Nitrospirillum amazonense]ASG20825.1 hypothetical protein Y958_08395 [Nitrospirillum amazonense CBAmc]EGY01473.1 hypothetical protein AZA_69008 [Nitrospirillum amazonense Y2]TWB37833.1 hypothetical protein FBZ91_107146 [Nitrospirillum amazonense]TWB63334.1 hypothetical protein FBZ92_10488 [Nitrospirillum amazonense]
MFSLTYLLGVGATMSYGLYDHSRRARRRFWGRLGKFLLLAGVVGVACAFSYEVGQEQLIRREQNLQTQLTQAQSAKEETERKVAQLQAALQTAEVRVSELQVRYDRDVPTGDLGRLKDLLAKKMVEGVDAGRLALIIEQTGTPRSCGKAETKRFVLSTSLYKGPNTSAGFADGAITVSGEGATSRSPDGAPQSWFDPAKPVTLKFTDKNGKETQTTGMLPLQHSVIIDDTEYRFKISPGSRSFVDVVGDHCPFP